MPTPFLSASPVGARRRAMPDVAEICAVLANLVGDTTTAAKSRYPVPLQPYCLFCRVIDPGLVDVVGLTISSTYVNRVRRPRPAHTSTSFGSIGPTGLVAARPVRTTLPSMGPRDVFQADSSAEDSTTSSSVYQEPPIRDQMETGCYVSTTQRRPTGRISTSISMTLSNYSIFISFSKC